jgi:SAM-dependent methyltransferase
MLQDNVFMESEGDRWFERNRTALYGFDAAADWPLRLVELYTLRPESVLEIGAANGFRLAALHSRSGTRVVAVEPSAQAILEGKASFPMVTFVRGTAHAVPLQERFELVIVNFVFHWIDRAHLLRSVAEVDRLVAEGGYLIIGDFHPANRLRVPYHHRVTELVYTYKQNYAEIFLASGLYHSVGLLSGGHAAKRLTGQVAENERIGAWLLRKELRDHYLLSGVNSNGA